MTRDSINPFMRQDGILNPDAIKATNVTVVGCGAIGRQIALQCAHIGIVNLTLIDPDVVSEENIGPQGWGEKEVGQPKVGALSVAIANAMPSQFPAPEGIVHTLHMHPEKVETCFDTIDPSRMQVVFNVPDDIEVRAWVFEKVRRMPECEMMVDVRMSGEAFIEYVCMREKLDTWSRYQETLFPKSEADEESCNARMTNYGANIAAGYAVSNIRRYLSGIPCPFRVMGTLAALSLSVKD